MFLQLYDIQGGLRIVKFAARVRPSTDNPVIVGYPAKERTSYSVKERWLPSPSPMHRSCQRWITIH